MDIEKKQEQPLRATPVNSSDGDDYNHSRKKQTRRRCIYLTAAVTLAVVVLVLILAFTVFKVKKPTTTVNSVVVKDLNVSLDIPQLRVELNLSMAVDISLHNPNKIGFKFGDATAVLRYKGRDIGYVPVPGGKVGADKTKEMSFTATIMADRLFSNSELYSDVLSGSLPVSLYTKISGKVRILLFNIHFVSKTTCDMDIDISSRSVANQVCHYKTKL